MFRNLGFSYNNIAAAVATLDGDDNSINYNDNKNKNNKNNNNKNNNNKNNNNDNEILNNVSVPHECNKQSNIPHSIQITRQELY